MGTFKALRIFSENNRGRTAVSVANAHFARALPLYGLGMRASASVVLATRMP